MQEIHSVDDVTELVARQIGKLMPLNEETREQFQQIVKKMIEQAGKAKHFPACSILSDKAPGFPLDNDYG